MMVVTVCCAALATWFSLPARARLLVAPTPPPTAAPVGLLARFRPVWSVAAGLGVATLSPGPVAPLAGVAGLVMAWVVIGRAESPEVRRARIAVRRDLPHVVDLLAAALRAGSAPADALAVVSAALPGAATERLRPVSSRLSLGVDPVLAWGVLAQDAELAVLGRAWARAHETGASVVATMERLADDLASAARAEVEGRARTVGVKAAVPLGLCLLPAFLLIGIVPVVAGMLGSLGL